MLSGILSQDDVIGRRIVQIFEATEVSELVYLSISYIVLDTSVCFFLPSSDIGEIHACQLPSTAAEFECTENLIGRTITNVFKVYAEGRYSDHALWLELDSGWLVSSIGASPIGIPDFGLIIETRQEVQEWYELHPFWKSIERG